MKEGGVPLIWPPGGHAVYIKLNEMFPEREWNEYMGCGLAIELIRRFGIRGCELGYMAWELDVYLEKHDGKFPEKMPPNYVRLAIPANVYGPAHINYVAEAVTTLFKEKDSIPSVTISAGKYTPLRHFSVELEPKY